MVYGSGLPLLCVGAGARPTLRSYPARTPMDAMTPIGANQPKIRCMIWGGYGHGNVGDELTLTLGCMDMRRRYGNSFAILSGTPGYTMALFPGVTVIPYVPNVRKPGLGTIPFRLLN